MMPPAPGRWSTTTCCFRVAVGFCLTKRGSNHAGPMTTNRLVWVVCAEKFGAISSRPRPKSTSTADRIHALSNLKMQLKITSNVNSVVRHGTEDQDSKIASWTF
jgi:hypothetical protein